MGTRISLWITVLLFFFPLIGHSQWKISPEFLQVLQQVDAEVMPPLDAGYKVRYPVSNRTQNYQWVLRSRKERLEIRYLVSPFTASNPTLKYPAIAAHRLAMHVCSNEEEAMISARDLDEEELQDFYNADWGKIYIFPPKDDFSTYAYCQLVVLFKVDRGIVYLFHLFDEPSPAIDQRLYSFRFKENQ
ncbi:MAG: hypothetical protein AAF242_21050 [Bacteroidota bacterium]